jgi:hypothetical protein
MAKNPRHTCIDCETTKVIRPNMRCGACVKVAARKTAQRYAELRKQANVDDAKARRAVFVKAQSDPPHPCGWGNGVCVDCGAPTIGKMMRCLGCQTLALREIKKKWEHKNRARRLVYYSKWAKAHPPATRPAWRRWYEADKAKRASERTLARSIVLTKTSPDFVYGRLAAMLARGIPGRDDILGDAILDLLEGKTTIELLEAGDIRKYIRRFHRSNFEAGGFGVSLSQPRFDGRSWDDILLDTSGAFAGHSDLEFE